MKKLNTLLLSLALAFVGFSHHYAMAAPEFTFSLNLPIPPIHTRWQGPIKTWVEEIEKRSNGRIKIEPYFAEALSPRSEAFESVKAGIADITECAYEANSGQFPFHEGILSISSPGLALDNGTSLVKGIYKKHPQVLKELEGIKLLCTHGSTSLVIGTTKKNITSLENLKGLKLNVNSAIIGERLKKLGVSVIFMPYSDLYTAMEQGVIEGTTMAPELLVSRRWGDCIKYITLLSVQNTLFYIVMNEDRYNELPDDLKKVVDDVSGEFADKLFSNYWANADILATKKWLADMGGKEVSVLSDDEYAKATKNMQEPVDKWFEMLTQKCGLPGSEIKKTFYDLEKELGTPWKESNFYKAYQAVKK